MAYREFDTAAEYDAQAALQPGQALCTGSGYM
eukprot:CAMPEP_0117573120 /NCGR_PEP_ID=MMETSP0784-20121206/60767_1 /TAXON_ID=39447 /ORGANISM="" /LENGTH=31 /DNA_ID= /DNA_START= /DNA_END= /DNA_ORIENTATION=